MDATDGLLLRDGQAVPIAPKTYDTLLTLVENSGRVLSKGELMQAVWPDSYVEEANLTHHISALRKALAEGAGGGRYIETYEIATIYVGLDEKDQAFAWLEKAYEERASFLIFLNVDSRLEGLRPEPRFADLVRRIGLPQ